MTVISRETFFDVIDEIKPLLERHWQEIARNKDVIKLDPDYDRYKHLEKSGLLRVYTVRKDGALIGYAAYFVNAHMHYRQDRWAVSDIIWLAPEYRRGRTGIALVNFIEAELTKEGVSVMHTTGKEAHPALRMVLEYLGHDRIEFGYSKLLKGAK